MKLFARWSALLVAMLLATTSLRADNAPAPVTDATQVSAHYRQLLAQPQYQEVAEPPVNTRIEDWLSQWFKSLGARFGEFRYASRMPAFESLLMTLLVIFAIAILLYIMVRLTRRRGKMAWEADGETPDQKAFRLPEDYDQEIRAAIREGDWHSACLAAWRQFLSRLEHRHLVDADRTRTNREYLAQLRGKPLPGSALALLNGLVDAYDRYIYGRQSIAEGDWDLFRKQINEAVLLLHLEEKVKASEAGATP